MQKLFKTVLIAGLALVPVFCSGASAKRGLGWDESKVNLNENHASQLAPGVSWVYNWGPDAGTADIYADDFYFVPMAWNGAYNATRIRNWLTAHPETKYLLGFNEPNFADQAAMTPQQAADKWPELEAIAAEFGVKLVAPALNFSGSQVGGKVWEIYEWYDEFFRLLPNAHVDCLALHCYMNWYTAMSWFATEYFYKDLYNAANRSKYPNLVRFMDNFKAEKGHYPRMMLTEFCAWEDDGSITGVDFQIDQMTQKVQMLELSDLVEGYAWFMGNASAASFPYMSVFQTNSANSRLSELGKVYVNMSSFDTSRYYKPGEKIQAKDYVDATKDNSQIKLRSNSETSSPYPLQIEMPKAGYTNYQIEVPADGSYTVVYRVKSTGNAELTLYVDNKKDVKSTIENTNGQWTDISVETTLKAGKHIITPYNTGNSTVWMNVLSFNGTGAIDSVEADSDFNREITGIFTVQGANVGHTDAGRLDAGLYIMRHADGKASKFLKH